MLQSVPANAWHSHGAQQGYAATASATYQHPFWQQQQYGLYTGNAVNHAHQQWSSYANYFGLSQQQQQATHPRYYNNVQQAAVQQFMPPYQAQQSVFNPGHQHDMAYHHGEPRHPPYWLPQQWAANQFSHWGQSQVPPQRAASSASMSVPRQPQQSHQFASAGTGSQTQSINSVQQHNGLKQDFNGIDYFEGQLTHANHFTPVKARPITVIRMANPAFKQAGQIEKGASSTNTPRQPQAHPFASATTTGSESTDSTQPNRLDDHSRVWIKQDLAAASGDGRAQNQQAPAPPAAAASEVEAAVTVPLLPAAQVTLPDDESQGNSEHDTSPPPQSYDEILATLYEAERVISEAGRQGNMNASFPNTTFADSNSGSDPRPPRPSRPPPPVVPETGAASGKPCEPCEPCHPAPSTAPSHLRVPQLRAELRKLGLDTKGTKPILLARLKEALAKRQ